jgi:hypothetical protein
MTATTARRTRTPVTRTGAQLTPYTIDRRIIGTPAEVAAAVATLRHSGRLITMTTPRQMPGDDPRVFVHVRILAPRPGRHGVHTRAAQPRTWRRRRWPLAVAGASTAVTVVAGSGYLLGRTVAPAVDGRALLAALAALLVAVWLFLGRAGVCCPGLHCPGCKH